MGRGLLLFIVLFVNSFEIIFTKNLVFTDKYLTWNSHIYIAYISHIDKILIFIIIDFE